MKGIGRYARDCDHEGIDHTIVGDICLQPSKRVDVETAYDLHSPRARRYAEALAIAAAADKRIELLIEQVTEHEWHRSQAEQQVDSIRTLFDASLGKLITSTDEEPEHVGALIDLYSGRVWVHPTYNSGNPEPDWIRLDARESGQTRYSWPIEDAGPFLPVADGWDLDKVNRDARTRDQTEATIRERVRNENGYRDSDVGHWQIPDLAPAVARVIAAKDARWLETDRERRKAEDEVRRLARLLAQANEKIAELTPEEGAES